MPAVAFDVIGTLFALDVAIDQLAATFPNLSVPSHVAFYLWLWAGLRDYFASSHAGPYVPLMTVLRASLPRTLAVVGYDMSVVKDEDYDAVMASFKRLELAPGMADAVKRLSGLGWEVWGVTNGGKEATIASLGRTGLLEYFGGGKNVQSCDDLQLSKPHPRVYNTWMRTVVHETKKIETFMYINPLSLPPLPFQNFYFIATHAWDLGGAHNNAIRTVFLTTEEKIYIPGVFEKPDVQGDTIEECVEQMVGLERRKSLLWTKGTDAVKLRVTEPL
ncbi:HAD-like domain-containing protein [Jimgerdemannia flammicorona]|uniref:HAD-like domain-containing protein n=1 Tax=Jimgerdemannia flammicorona TaxID=994334 RepID=A0A433D494_9FUNG|nr:HAD-like domain-containing protein [Jimgerdemannia flammicorona]